MNTTQAFLDALKQPAIQGKYLDSTIRTWRSRANKDMISLDFMVNFLSENGYHMMQIMTWSHSGTAADQTSARNTVTRWTREDEGSEAKTELGKKLNAVRKEMNKELFSRWFEWSKSEYTQDHPNRRTGITTIIFAQMTSGRYISKENTLFAVKALKEGRRMVQEYEEYIRIELESL